MFKVQTFQVNLLQENTYVVSDETKECPGHDSRYE